MASLDDLRRKQADAAHLAMQMVGETDPERLGELTAQLQERCGELEKMVRGMEAAGPAEVRGAEVRVQLTPAQRERIAEQTGVGVEVVTLRDSAQRRWSKEMPRVEPREIEKLAAKQAAQSRLQSETRTRVERIIRELEALNLPELEPTLAELRARTEAAGKAG